MTASHPQLMIRGLIMDPCQPLVAGGFFPRHHRLGVVEVLRAGDAVAPLLGALSVQWVSDGTRGVSGVLTVMIYSSTSAPMSATENRSVISITMRCV